MSATAPGDFGRVASSLRWTLLGEVMFAGGQFGLLMAMARLGSDAALGRYALGLAIATPLFVLTSLHLRPTYVVSDDPRLTFGHYMALRLIGAPAAVVLAAVWCVSSGHDATTTAVVLGVAVMRMSEMLADICHAAAGREEQLDRVGISRALRGGLLLGGVAGALAAGLSEATALAIGAALGLALTLTYDLGTARRFANPKPRFEGASLLALTKLAAPVGLAGGLLGLTTNTPAYVLEWVDGVEELGQYAAVISVLFISGVLNAAVGGAAVPRLARLFGSDRPGFTRLLLRVSAVVTAGGTALFGACWLLGDVYLGLAYGPRFTDLTPQLTVAGGIALVAGVANLLSQTLVAMRRFRLQFLINAVTFGLGLVLAGLLIPGQGLFGALVTLGSITALRLVTYAIIISRLIRRAT